MKKFLSKLNRGKAVQYLALALAIGAITLCATHARADGGVTLPTFGVDVPGTIDAFGAQIGASLSKILGYGVLVIAIMFAWRKFRRIS